MAWVDLAVERSGLVAEEIDQLAEVEVVITSPKPIISHLCFSFRSLPDGDNLS